MSGSRNISWGRFSIFVIATAVFVALLGPTLIGKGDLNLGFVYLNRALSNSTQEQKAKALQNSERLFTRGAESTQVREAAKRGLGLVFWQKGNSKGAVASFREAQFPVENLVSFGDIANTLGKRDEALFWYESAAAIDLEGVVVPLAEHLNQQREYQAAIDIWEEGLTAYPKSPQRLDWWLGLSYSLRSNQEWQRAVDVSNKALNEFPKNPPLLTSLASALLGLEADYETISTVLQEAMSLDSSLAEPYSVMASLLARESRYEEAFTYYDRAIERDPSIMWWHVARANSARRLGNLEGAKTLLLQTVDLFPKYAPAYYELAWILKLTGEPIEAQTAIQQALNLHNSPPVNYYVRAGDIYAWSNAFDQARSAYQHAAALAPHDQRVIQGLDALSKIK